MYEYKFIRLELRGLIESKPKQDYHAIVEEHAKEGWRLVQVLAPPTGAYGTATHFELIFEKQI
ncbi:DUF4177 domain-containing protein [Clostridium gasigenes]|uniref:DUF4177 domain-containing protein n=1 Tax=Clostridium gasigenes TaxID=94869 RepID=A0A7X0VQF3_9CLOT|nr:DUF4177 domain-containing protein [Clostridium gasigenes]MBB6713928.1 DUF4177 domain-containing protein [Clostridium gasigenes]